MCRKNISRRRPLSRRSNCQVSNRKRYATAIAAAQIGERPIPVLTGKSAVSFLMKASVVENELSKENVFMKPAELKAFKNYAKSVAAMEAESQKLKLK